MVDKRDNESAISRQALMDRPFNRVSLCVAVKQQPLKPLSLCTRVKINDVSRDAALEGFHRETVADFLQSDYFPSRSVTSRPDSEVSSSN